MKLGQPLRKLDCLLVMGSHDLRVAEHGARLYLEGWAPLIVFSGGLGNQTRNIWKEAEADIFARLANDMGVPEEKMLIENQSTNTGENVLFTRILLKEHKLDPTSFLLVHKPYMERRAFTTFKKIWPEKAVYVTSPPIEFKDYPTTQIPLEDVVDIMVGDFQRVMLYPQMGFQIEQKIPENALYAYMELVRMGFNHHLINKLTTLK